MREKGFGDKNERGEVGCVKTKILTTARHAEHATGIEKKQER
jgi:hypothetical protein